MALILVIESDLEQQAFLTGALRSEGHRVIDVVNGVFGLRLAELHEPDLVVLNMKLSDMPGGDVIRALREDEILHETPIVALPGGGAASIDEALEAGANSVLSQPRNARLLDAKVKEALGGGRDDDDGLKPPEILSDIYSKIVSSGRTIGDCCEVFQGVAVKDKKKYMAEVLRGPRWRPILVEKDIRPFRAEHGSMHVFYEPRMLLRAPAEALMLGEKVVLPRSAPPFCAAVERDRLLTDVAVYNIVPADGLLPEYIVAVLNSRMMDYFIRRVRPLKHSPGIGTMLRTIDIEDLPLLVPDTRTQQAVRELVIEVERASFSTRHSHHREKFLSALNFAVFEIFGFSKTEIDRLVAMSF